MKIQNRQLMCDEENNYIAYTMRTLPTAGGIASGRFQRMRQGTRTKAKNENLFDLSEPRISLACRDKEFFRRL